MLFYCVERAPVDLSTRYTYEYGDTVLTIDSITSVNIGGIISINSVFTDLMQNSL